MEGFATAYPVLFFDGEQKYDKGNVGLHSLLYYKKFQTIIAQLTGIPPNQQSTVFVCRRSLKSMSEKRQRLPINENTNFAIILNQHNPSREKDCYFLVSVKKSKRDRKGRGKRNADAVEVVRDDYDESGSSIGGEFSLSDEWRGYQEKKNKKGGGGGGAVVRVKPEKTILRRETTTAVNNGAARFSLGALPLSRGIPVLSGGGENGGFVDQGRWFPDESGFTGRPYVTGRSMPEYYPRSLYVPEGLQFLNPGVFTSRLNSLQNTGQFFKAAFGNETGDFLQGQGHMAVGSEASSVYSSPRASTNSSSICEKCWMSKERPIPFHFCVNDAITAGFRGPSPAGPIERPVRAAA